MINRWNSVVMILTLVLASISSEFLQTELTRNLHQLLPRQAVNNNQNQNNNNNNNNQTQSSSTPAAAASNSASTLTNSTSALQTPTAAQPLLNNDKQPILSQKNRW
uniref:Uncharacterized protein n=1 Tax=Phakopsora pachyrhizi TaxID=170000 RepID=A0A0S1MJK0_PHAPC